MEKILVILDTLLAQSAGISAERLFAKPVGEATYLIDSIPFFASGINLGDTVSARRLPHEELPIFSDVIARSGHATCRVRVAESDPEAAKDAEALLELLRTEGCSMEKGFGIVAIDVPPMEHTKTLLSIVENAASEGVWSVF